jgi:hypothetical protein
VKLGTSFTAVTEMVAAALAPEYAVLPPFVVTAAVDPAVPLV